MSFIFSGTPCMVKIVRNSYGGKDLQQMTKVTGLCVYRNFDPRGMSAITRGYIHVCYH